jgi:sugar phosphate isomerase/epimerase
MRDIELSRCAINTATLGFQVPLPEVIDAVARAGFGCISPWRREVEGQDVAALARHIRDAGMKVNGYCRSTYLPSDDGKIFHANIEQNVAALRDAATLRADHFVMVVGSHCDIEMARRQVVEATGILLEHGKELGVKIALEPLHPIYAAERSCLTLLSEALRWCGKIEGAVAQPGLGVCIDAYHVWWDPELYSLIKQVGDEGRIFAFHVCDWLVPTADVLNDRGMMGDGVIDLRKLRRAVFDAGFQGPVETEIFSVENWWKRPMAETLGVVAARLKSTL